MIIRGAAPHPEVAARIPADLASRAAAAGSSEASARAEDPRRAGRLLVAEHPAMAPSVGAAGGTPAEAALSADRAVLARRSAPVGRATRPPGPGRAGSRAQGGRPALAVRVSRLSRAPSASRIGRARRSGWAGRSALAEPHRELLKAA